MLASPEVGFIVPTNAISNSGQNAVVIANPAPVAVISNAAASSKRRTEYRLATIPAHNVTSAVPISVLVTIAPISNALKPSSSR